MKVRGFILLLAISCMIGCLGAVSREFEDADQIISIEIVEVSAYNIVSLVTIETSLKDAFLQGLSALDFHRVFGDPPEPYGICVRIVYADDDYEMIGYYGSYRVHQSEETVTYSWLVCDEDEFFDFIDGYYSTGR